MRKSIPKTLVDEWGVAEMRVRGFIVTSGRRGYQSGRLQTSVRRGSFRTKWNTTERVGNHTWGLARRQCGKKMMQDGVMGDEEAALPVEEVEVALRVSPL